MSHAELTAAIKALPYEEKEELWEMLARDLAQDPPPEVLDAQVDEVLRRRQDWLDGKTKLIPGEQVMREMREMLDRMK